MTGGAFVTGTDTGVGKTFVACALAVLLRERGVDVGVMKPAETGVSERAGYPEDAARLVAASGADDPPDLVCPYRLREPLAPAVAAELEGRRISIEKIREAYAELSSRHELMIVEGAGGGLAVPLNGEMDMAGLAKDLELPVLVVAHAGLGTINHRVLTVEYAFQRGLEVLGVVLNLCPETPGAAERTNPGEILRLTGVPVYGSLPRLSRGTPDDTLPDSLRISLEELVSGRLAGLASDGYSRRR